MREDNQMSHDSERDERSSPSGNSQGLATPNWSFPSTPSPNSHPTPEFSREVHGMSASSDDSATTISSESSQESSPSTGPGERPPSLGEAECIQCKAHKDEVKKRYIDRQTTLQDERSSGILTQEEYQNALVDALNLFLADYKCTHQRYIKRKIEKKSLLIKCLKLQARKNTLIQNSKA